MTRYCLNMCVWEITLACSFSCRYCGSSGGRARANELTTKECLHVADELGALGCERVSLIGGEVFMRRDWKEIVARLMENRISVNIITNGFLFAEKILSELKELNIESVSVSIDGPKDIHDRYRQAGSYDRAMDALRRLCEAKIPASVISTLNSENVKRLPELLSVLREYPIYAWQLQACSPMGNAAKMNVPFAFDPCEVILFVEENMNEVPFALGIADNIGYFTPSEGYLRGNRGSYAEFPGCSAGIRVIGIDSVGNVRGCESMYDDCFIEGNLRERSLKDIWEDPEAFAYNRKFRKELLTGKCAECEMGIYCAGGCRSYNYFVHGKLYEAPRCARYQLK